MVVAILSGGVAERAPARVLRRRTEALALTGAVVYALSFSDQTGEKEREELTAYAGDPERMFETEQADELLVQLQIAVVEKVCIRRRESGRALSTHQERRKGGEEEVVIQTAGSKEGFLPATRGTADASSAGSEGEDYYSYEDEFAPSAATAAPPLPKC